LFTYDSLSRLLTAYNPESGTISYGYDAVGNLLQKTSPAPNQTGTAAQTVSYCYDELNRITKRDYSAHTFAPPACPITSPVVSYAYDQGANAKGHLTSLTDQAGSASFTYDVLGRMSGESRTTNGVTKNMSYHSAWKLGKIDLEGKHILRVCLRCACKFIPDQDNQKRCLACAGVRRRL
jgi:YD repeat-containing protein